MYRGLRISVVMPAFDEADAIAAAIASVPSLVDQLIVVDDASRDATADLALAQTRELELIRHPKNRGVGASIITGYQRVLDQPGGADVVVVMAGDGQMDPSDLPRLLDPIAEDRADYAKGNRFAFFEVWREMPPSRILGNMLLSIATKATSGYWRVFDSQCGYTAITRHALGVIDLERVFPRYGYPNDLLARLHAAGLRVVDVPVRPVYGPAWKSGIRVPAVVGPISKVLLRSWLERLGSELGARAPRPLPAPGEQPGRRSVRAITR
jgi:glycosyltransferase involved in cell wall biosynthesis